MSASKFLNSSILLFRSNNHRPLFPIPSFISPKPLLFRSYCSSAALEAVTSDNTPTDQEHHPWPEWVSFVDRLKTSGYFTTIEPVYKDINQLKDPCLSFARDRYDLVNSLSKDDIQSVLETGCPNTLRKTVNSAKRLRVHAELDEGDVCSACNLRGSCDRAYVILKDHEAKARTVDIVRILMDYALDPLVFSGEGKPPGRETVEAAIRKLLSELIQLSQKIPPPPTPEPAAKVVDWKEPKPAAKVVNQKERRRSGGEKQSQDFEIKKGDWMCPQCNFMNFARNVRCLQCREESPKKDDAVSEMKEGDWKCSKCDFMNFARNVVCLKCKTEGPKGANVEMKKGDWNCPQCEFMNFATNKKCLRCQELRPKRQLSNGEWECPSCDFVNFSRNMSCRKCKSERPNEATNYEEHVWRSPR